MRKPTILLAASFLAMSIAQGALADGTAPSGPAEAPAPAAAPAQPASDHVPDAKKSDAAEVVADADPMICRTQTETGSRVRRTKVCMTQSEWEAHRQAARRYKENIDRSRSAQPGGGG
jgi:hypothetical protein